ncbi:hypothetical protein G0P98_27730, partial [Yangia sp. PrR004]|nr:hypothetical protein [Salipiger sp. PrR004]
VAALLPDDSVDLLDTDDLFYAPPEPDTHRHRTNSTKPAAYDVDVLRALSLGSVVGAPSPRAHQQQQMRQVVDRPAQHVGGVRAAARRTIH